ncbi:MAG: hypothetical protein EOO48_13095 [Flavobacterium sp.]|nr:MAG: hypothetical protein EOO48_13095 [Flavobacterium sp.]
MKKLFLLILIGTSFGAYCQKKKPAAKTSAAKTVLTKSGDLSAELSERKDNYRFYVITGKDTLTAKTISKQNGAPTNVKITPFNGGTAKLQAISWVEKKTVGDAKSKLENISETHTEVWDAATKTRVYENVQMVNNISEVVWLDPNKTASKTVEKIKRDGCECSINPDGDIVLKNKTQESRLKYDPVTQKFVPRK